MKASEIRTPGSAGKLGTIIILAGFLLAAMDQGALAQASGDPFSPITTVVSTVLSYMQGTLGRICAGLAVAFAGYRFLYGHAPWQVLFIVVVGAALVIGSGQIVALFG